MVTSTSLRTGGTTFAQSCIACRQAAPFASRSIRTSASSRNTSASASPSSSSSSSSSVPSKISSKSQAPLLPSGRLPAKDLRQLVELHHLSSSFVTPSRLSSAINLVFSQGSSIKQANDSNLRELASAKLRAELESGEAFDLVSVSSSPDSEGAHLSPAFDYVQSRKGGVVPLKVLGYASGHDASPIPQIKNHKREQGGNWAGSTSNSGMINGLDDSSRYIHSVRERRLREAMTGTFEGENVGTVGPSGVPVATAKPGLEALLEYEKN